MQRATLRPSLSPPSQNASFSCGFPAFSRRAVIWKSLTKSIPVLLGLSLFAATEAAAQAVVVRGGYASPYLNPLYSQNNPAAIVWREKSMVGVAHVTSIIENGTPMTTRETTTINRFVLANMGDFFGIKSGFELLIGDVTSKREFVDSDTTDDINGQQFDKVGGFALGPLAVGYTDANEVKANFIYKEKNTDYLLEMTGSYTQKANRKGLSLKLSNLFVGVSQSSTETKDVKIDLKQTQYSDSSVTNYSLITSDHRVNVNTGAIAFILGAENENRFRLEIYRTHTPEVVYPQTFINLSDGTTSTSTTSDSESSENGVVLETKINNYYYALEYSKAVTLDAGTSSGKAYSNTIEQEISASLGTPLSESIRITVFSSQSVEAQTYTASDEYRSYSAEKVYEMVIGYEF